MGAAEIRIFWELKTGRPFKTRDAQKGISELLERESGSQLRILQGASKCPNFKKYAFYLITLFNFVFPHLIFGDLGILLGAICFRNFSYCSRGEIWPYFLTKPPID